MKKETLPHKASGFTLVELLVVLAIIGLLAALLFPAFKRMQERASQTSCIANLNQISVAVRQYFQDDKAYPSSLTYLMPVSAEFDGNPATTDDNAKSAAYLSSLDIGRCPNDDTDSTAPRLSYGQFGLTAPAALTSGTPPTDGGEYMWNYWGYRDDGYAYQSAQEAADGQGTGPTYPYLLYKNQPYNHPYASGFTTGARNVVEKSLSNRYATPDTIITHCIYHRTNTSDLNGSTELYYSVDPAAGTNARDIVILLDGSAKTLNVNDFKTNSQWLKQKF